MTRQSKGDDRRRVATGQPPGHEDPDDSSDFAAEHADTDVDPHGEGDPARRRPAHGHTPTDEGGGGPVV